MNRRQVIRDLFLVSGVFVLAPYCRLQNDRVAIKLSHMHFSAEDEQLLSSISSAIIPGTDSPSAGELGCHLFTVKMLNDCYELDVQEIFLQGMKAFDLYAKQNWGNSFEKCTPQQQQEIFTHAEAGTTKQQIIADFFGIMKEKTIQGFMTSKYVLTNINKYEFIPSVKYNGYAPVTL